MVKTHRHTTGTKEVICKSKDCTARGVSKCVQCGDLFCQTHTRITRHKSVRCTSCLSAILKRLVVCAERSNRLEEAAEALLPWTKGATALPEAEHYLALIRAEQGALDSALKFLQPLAADKPEVTQTMAQLHLLRAAQAVTKNEMTRAAQDVAQAVHLNPHLEEAQQALLVLRNWQVLAHLRANQLQEALQLWEKELLERPTDLILIHRLAILYYRLASEASESATNGSATEEYWRKAIAAWATVLQSSNFFRQWQQEREQDTDLKFSDEDLSQAQKALAERLLRDLRDLAVKEGSNQRLQELDVVWSFERQSARLMSEYFEENRVSNWPAGFACGPLMLACLNKTSVGKPLVMALQRQLPTFTDKAGQTLQKYLSPLGRAHFLIEENRLDQAIAFLSQATTRDSKPLLAQAYCAKGQELVQLYKWEEALATFEGAQAAGGNLKDYTEAIAEAGVKGGKAILDASPEDNEKAIQLLKRCHALIGDHPDINANLGATYAQQARLANNADRFEEAERLIRIAFKYSPNDPQTRHFVRVTLGNLAFSIVEEEPERAVTLFKEALTYENDAETSKILSNILFTQALSQAFAGNRQRAIELMHDNIQYDPEFNIPPTTESAKDLLKVVLARHGSELAKEGKLAAAIDLVKEARQYADDAELRQFLSFLLFEADRYHEAAQVLRTALQHEPHNTGLKQSLHMTLHNLGLQLARNAQFDQAINSFHEALKYENAQDTQAVLAQCYTDRAILKFKNGNSWEAKQDIQQALRYDPNNHNLRKILSQL